MARTNLDNIVDNYKHAADFTRKNNFTHMWLRNVPPELRNANMRNGLWSSLPLQNPVPEGDTFVMGGGGGTGVGL